MQLSIEWLWIAVCAFFLAAFIASAVIIRYILTFLFLIKEVLAAV